MSNFLWQAIEWNYDELPSSDPCKRYLIVYAPWDYGLQANTRPRFSLANYYTGNEPSCIYSDKPWHLDCCYSIEKREVLCWADVGDVGDIVKKFLSVKADAYFDEMENRRINEPRRTH